MITVRLLAAVTAYVVVLLEVYSGVIRGPWWWGLPGGLVISLLIATSIFGDQLGRGPGADAGNRPTVAFGQWLLILAVAFGVSFFSYAFGRFIIPDIMPTLPPS